MAAWSQPTGTSQELVQTEMSVLGATHIRKILPQAGKSPAQGPGRCQRVSHGVDQRGTYVSWKVTMPCGDLRCEAQCSETVATA